MRASTACTASRACTSASPSGRPRAACRSASWKTSSRASAKRGERRARRRASRPCTGWRRRYRQRGCSLELLFNSRTAPSNWPSDGGPATKRDRATTSSPALISGFDTSVFFQASKHASLTRGRGVPLGHGRGEWNAKKPVGQEELDIGVADTSTVCDVPRTSSAPPPRRRCSSIVHEDRFRTLGRQEALLVWIRDSELMCSGQSRCGRGAEGTLSGPLVPSPRQIVSGTNEDSASGNRGCDTSNLRM
jgi:hypothetical protein